MSVRKKAGLFLVITCLILTSLVVFGNYIVVPEVTKTQKHKNTKTDGDNIGDVVPPSAGRHPIAEGDEKIAVAPSAPRNDEELMSISEKIAASIQELNPEGPVDFNDEKVIRALNPETIASEVILEELAKIDEINLGLNDIELKEIKVSSDSSKNAVEQYLKDFQNILIKNFRGITEIDLDLLARAHKNSIDDFYKLETPATLAEVHKQEILLLSQQMAILEALQNAESNPLVALAALKKKGSIEEGFIKLNGEIGKIIASIKSF